MNITTEILTPRTEKIKTKLAELTEQQPDFAQFLERAKKLGNLALVGGSLRDWLLDKQPRDLDLMIHCHPDKLYDLVASPDHDQSYTGNYFGSFKAKFQKLEIDIWALKETWAFTQDKKWEPSFESWLETPFFNIDSILYLIHQEALLIGSFDQAFQDRVLDIVYQPNLSPSLCVLKSLLHQKKYDLIFSDNLMVYLFEKVFQNQVTTRDLASLYKNLFNQPFPESLLAQFPKEIEIYLKRNAGQSLDKPRSESKEDPWKAKSAGWWSPTKPRNHWPYRTGDMNPPF